MSGGQALLGIHGPFRTIDILLAGIHRRQQPYTLEFPKGGLGHLLKKAEFCRLNNRTCSAGFKQVVYIPRLGIAPIGCFVWIAAHLFDCGDGVFGW